MWLVKRFPLYSTLPWSFLHLKEYNYQQHNVTKHYKGYYILCLSSDLAKSKPYLLQWSEKPEVKCILFLQRYIANLSYEWICLHSCALVSYLLLLYFSLQMIYPSFQLYSLCTESERLRKCEWINWMKGDRNFHVPDKYGPMTPFVRYLFGMYVGQRAVSSSANAWEPLCSDPEWREY